MKKTTIWISHGLTPRHSVNGWPELQSFEWHVGQGASGREYEEFCENKLLLKEYEETVVAEYDKALAKAKEESIAFDFSDEYKRAFVPDGFNKPDTFLEIDGEVYSVDQYYDEESGEWVDMTHGINGFNKRRRTVARLKPAEAVNSAHGYTEGSEPQMPTNEKKWREEQHEQDKKSYTDQDRLFSILKNSFISSGEDPASAHDLTRDVMPYLEEYLRQHVSMGNKYIQQQLAAAQATVKELEDSMLSIINAINEVPNGLVEYRYEEYDGKHYTMFWSIVAEAEKKLKKSKLK